MTVAGTAALLAHRAPREQREGWRSTGRCAQPGADPDLWTPAGNPASKAVRAQYEKARAECHLCAPRRDCLVTTLAGERGTPPHARYGMAGGLTPVERTKAEIVDAALRELEPADA